MEKAGHLLGPSGDFEIGFDEGLRLFFVEGITIRAALLHATGNPISQRGRSGFNGPLSSAGVKYFRSSLRLRDPPHLQSAIPPVFLTAVGVGPPTFTHKVEPLPWIRRSETASQGNRRPEGVTRSFQVSRNKVEPSKAVF